MKIEHKLPDTGLDLDELRLRVSERVGRPLGMVTSQPVDGQPGVLMFEEMGTDTRVALDPRVVVSIVDELGRELDQTRARVVTETRRTQEPGHVHVVPDVPPTAAGWLAGFDAAATDAQRFAAIRAFLAYTAGKESEYREQIAADIAAACEDGSIPCTLTTSQTGHGHGHGHGH